MSIQATATAKAKAEEVVMTSIEAWRRLAFDRRLHCASVVHNHNAWHAILVLDDGESKPVFAEGRGSEKHLAIGNAFARAGEVFEEEWMKQKGVRDERSQDHLRAPEGVA